MKRLSAFAYTLILSMLISSLAVGGELRKLWVGDLDMQQTDGGAAETATSPQLATGTRLHGGAFPWDNAYTRTIRPGDIIAGGPWVDSRRYKTGITCDNIAVQAAIDNNLTVNIPIFVPPSCDNTGVDFKGKDHFSSFVGSGSGSFSGNATSITNNLIVNADINSAANIDGSKLASNLVITTSLSAPSIGSTSYTDLGYFGDVTIKDELELHANGTGPYISLFGNSSTVSFYGDDPYPHRGGIGIDNSEMVGSRPYIYILGEDNVIGFASYTYGFAIVLDNAIATVRGGDVNGITGFLFDNLSMTFVLSPTVTIDNAELSYLDNVTSPIQTQLDGKVTGKRGAASSVTDNSAITHGVGSTPTAVICTPSIAGEMCSVTAISATTFTVALKTHVGAAGTSQTVYWIAMP